MITQRKPTRAPRLGPLLIALVHASIAAQAADLIVNDPRPVAEAVIALMKRHPVVITYEDPRYVYAGDLEDVTEKIRNPQAPRRTDGRRVFVPVGGQLQTRYDVSPATNKPADLRRTLENVVEAKAAVPAGGRFRIEQAGEVFHVIASQTRAASGRWVDHKSVLDVPITLMIEEASGFALVEAILKQVSATNGVNFHITTLPVTELLANYRGALAVHNELARDVMLRTLQGIYDRLTWLLYYDSSTGSYFFNIVTALSEPTIELREAPPSPRRGDATPTGVPFGERRGE